TLNERPNLTICFACSSYILSKPNSFRDATFLVRQIDLPDNSSFVTGKFDFSFGKLLLESLATKTPPFWRMLNNLSAWSLDVIHQVGSDERVSHISRTPRAARIIVGVGIIDVMRVFSWQILQLKRRGSLINKDVVMVNRKLPAIPLRLNAVIPNRAS